MYFFVFVYAQIWKELVGGKRACIQNLQQFTDVSIDCMAISATDQSTKRTVNFQILQKEVKKIANLRKIVSIFQFS